VKNLFDPPSIVRQAEDLAALASQINAEHAGVEGAVRKSLEHARTAGEALLRAKKQCGHGNWLPWLKANVQCSPKTATGYMRIAREWESNRQRVADLSFREALAELSRRDEAEPESEVIEIIKSYVDAGELTPAHVRILEALRDAYGSAQFGEFRVRENIERSFDNSAACNLLFFIRPEANRTVLPAEDTVPEIVRDACWRFIDAVTPETPQWQVAAFWWASLAIIHKSISDIDMLKRGIKNWRKRYEHALVWWSVCGAAGPPLPEEEAEGKLIWLGYLEDLVQAGSFMRAVTLREEEGGKALIARVVNDAERDGGFILPSCAECEWFTGKDSDLVAAIDRYSSKVAAKWPTAPGTEETSEAG
jgi:hypothetical protein